MRFITLLSLLVVSFVCLTVAQVSYDDCCLKYVKNLTRSIKKHAVNYRRQVPDGGCNLSAVIFKMKRGRVFCTDPKEKWVLDWMKEVDRKKVRSKHPRRPHKG